MINVNSILAIYSIINHNNNNILISKVHALIRKRPNRVYITDLILIVSDSNGAKSMTL